MFGISSFTAVVNPPQACILAVGAGISRIAPPKQAGYSDILIVHLLIYFRVMFYVLLLSPINFPISTRTVLTTGGNPRVVTTVTVQLSGDRRVVDEALAAQFLQVFKSYFSNPKLLYL